MTTQTKQEKTLLQHLDDLLSSGDYGTYVRDYIDLSADYFLNDEQKKDLESRVKVYLTRQPTEEDLEIIRKASQKVPVERKDFTEKGERKIREKAKTSIKKFEDITEPLSSLLDFIIVEKAPFGFKPLGNLFGGGDKTPSPEEGAVEKVPEGQRVYVDSKEEAPDGVEVLTGPEEGLFYDMNSLTSEEHGNEITNVFNNLLDQLMEAQSDEAVQQRAKENEANEQKMEEIRENFEQQHPKAEKLLELEAAINARNDELYAPVLNLDSTSAEIDELFNKIDSDKKLNNLIEEKFILARKISTDWKSKMDEDEEYQKLKAEVGEEKYDPTVKKIQSKLGNALIHSFKNGFPLDDMTFDVDPDLKYDDDPSTWARHIDRKVQNTIEKDVKKLQATARGREMLEDGVPNYKEFDYDKDMQLALAVGFFLGAEKSVGLAGEERTREILGEKGIQRAGHVAKIREFHNGNSLGLYQGKSNTFIASPNIWDKMSKLDDSGNLPTEMKEALKTMIHESLHSIGGNHAKHDGEGSARTDTATNYIEGKSVGLADAGIPAQQALNNFSQFMEEGPVELLAQSILGRKYSKDLVGKDVFTDKAFTEGAGSIENHASISYKNITPHLARWALAYSGGSPKRARALLGKMREVGAGQGEVDAQGNPNQAGVVDNHRLMNNYTASFGQYLKDYANKEWSPDATDAGVGFDFANGIEASQLGRGLSEGQDLKYGDNRIPNISLRPEIRDQEPIFDGGGNLTQAGHLDVMHLIYGKG